MLGSSPRPVGRRVWRHDAPCRVGVETRGRTERCAPSDDGPWRVKSTGFTLSRAHSTARASYGRRPGLAKSRSSSPHRAFGDRASIPGVRAKPTEPRSEPPDRPAEGRALPPGRWQDVARAARLLRADGTLAATVFAEMSALAVRTGAVNLGQGFPDTDGPEEVLEAAVRAVRGGRNQYPPGRGVPELRTAVAAHQRRFYGMDVDPDREVLVTVGATEAIAAAVLALCSPGDRGGDARAVLRLLRRDRRAGRRRAPDRAAALPRLRRRPRGAGRCVRPAYPDGAVELPAQPHRPGADPCGAHRGSRARREARRRGARGRGLRAPHLRRRSSMCRSPPCPAWPSGR